MTMIAATLLTAIASVAGSAATAPNVLLLWVDDVGYGDVGFNGNSTMRTPNLDRLAASGAVLTQHLVASPICTPSRAALLTGRHAIRSGMTSADPNFYVMGLGPGSLPESEITMAEALRARGYSTGMVGKWHLGGTADERGLPTRHGFESYWGMPVTNVQACRAGHQEYPHSTLLFFVMDRHPTGLLFATVATLAATPCLLGWYMRWRVLSLLVGLFICAATVWFTGTLTLINPKSCLLYANETVIEQPVELGYLTHRHTHKALAFLDAARRPFFLYLAYANAHTALFAMDENVGTSAHGLYGDNVEEMDASVGKVLHHLESRGELSDTIVYFASDNGPFREEGVEGGSCGYPPVLKEGAPLVTGPLVAGLGGTSSSGSSAGGGALRGGASSTALAASPARSPNSLRGAKGQTWECGLRVPAILSYPRRWRGGVEVHVATTAMDVMPTVLSLIAAASTGGDSSSGGSTSGSSGRGDGGVDASSLAQSRGDARWSGDLRPSRSHLRHVSELREGESATAGVLDGRSLVPLLDAAALMTADGDDGDAAGGVSSSAASMPRLDPHAADAVHDFIFHYCGAAVSAVRHGRWKAHYTTTKWEDEAGQVCRRNVICACHGYEHASPLMYDVHADPSELSPLNATTHAEAAAALRRIDAAMAKHRASLIAAPSQTIKIPAPWHLPCCDVERGSWAHLWRVLNNLCGC